MNRRGIWRQVGKFWALVLVVGVAFLPGCMWQREWVDLVPRLVASPTLLAPGEKIIVRFQGAPGDAGDWIAIYSVGAPNERYGEWYYLGGEAVVS